MTEENTHEYKMYSIVLRQLSGINNGIQTSHGVCEYVRNHWKDEDLQQWINKDKTLIVLNGGTTSNMNSIIETLTNEGIKFETFNEEDLGGLTTSICLLADERVWDYEKYPLFGDFINSYILANDFSKTYDEIEAHYLKFIGGHENDIKKTILSKMKTVNN